VGGARDAVRRTRHLADLTVDSAGNVLLLGNINPAHLIYNSSGDLDAARHNRSQGIVIRLTPAGARDPTLLGTGLRVIGSSLGGCAGNHFCDYDEPASIVTLPDNSIIVAGRYVPGGFLGATPSSYLTLKSSSYTGYTGAGQGFHDWTRSEGVSMLRQADGKLVIGGLVRTSSLASDVDFSIYRFQAP
jgi:hypothetical protein